MNDDKFTVLHVCHLIEIQMLPDVTVEMSNDILALRWGWGNLAAKFQ